VSYLVGFPICPGCYNLLDYNPMPDVGETCWYCSACKMWWETNFLIQCLEDEEINEYLCKEVTND